MDSEVRLLEFKYRILHLPALRLSADYQVCGLISSYVKWASQVALVVKNLPVNAGEMKEFSIWVGKIPWRKAQEPSPVFLPEESHGQRSLIGYSP